MGRQLSEAIVDGILGGSVYALMAVGLTLIFGVLDIINIAQGILVVLGAYLSYVLSVHLHIDLFVGLLVTVPAMFIIGVAIQWAFIRPLRGRERTSMSLLATYAVAIIIEGILYIIFGSNFVNLNASYVDVGPEDLRVLPGLHLHLRVPDGRCCSWRPSTSPCTGPSSAGASGPPCRTRPRPGSWAST